MIETLDAILFCCKSPLIHTTKFVSLKFGIFSSYLLLLSWRTDTAPLPMKIEGELCMCKLMKMESTF